MRPRRPKREPRGIMQKKKTCPFCEDKTQVVDYRDIKRVTKFTSEQGRVLTRRTSGVCSRHQRQLVTAIKHARHLALIPFVSDMMK